MDTVGVGSPCVAGEEDGGPGDDHAVHIKCNVQDAVYISCMYVEHKRMIIQL